jgi:hypothetical protein
MRYLVILSMLLLSSGCADALHSLIKAETLPDPTERGLFYVAWAILASAVVRAIFNK